MKKFRNIKSASQFFDLNALDVIKSFIVAILSASLGALYNLLTSWVVLWNPEWKFVLLAWVTAWLGYLIKNVFTNSNGDTFKRDIPV